MKNFLVITFLLSYVFTAFAGKNISIPTHAGKKVMKNWKADSTALKMAKKTGSLKYFAAFSAPIDNKMLVSFQDAGIRILGSAGQIDSKFVYTIIIPPAIDSAIDLLRTQNTFWNLEPVLSADKIDKNVRKKVNQHKAKGEFVDLLVYLENQFTKKTVGELKRLSAKVSEYPEGYNCYRISIVSDNVDAVSSLDEVREIVEYREKQYTIHDARELTNVNALQGATITKMIPPSTTWLNGEQNTGDSVWICINESGSNQHRDFYELTSSGDTVPRTINPASFGLSDHGTHVAGIAAGNGWQSHLAHFITADTNHWRGVAPKALVIPSGEEGDVNNHSFIEWSDGFYNSTSNSHDSRLSNHTAGSTNNNVGVFATANNGSSAQYGVQRGYYSLLVNNKNGIKVGACEKRRAKIASFSSIGPTRDGRVGPDVVAPGTGAFDLVYEIEIDSIALSNNGIKASWNFADAAPTWGVTSDLWQIWDLDHSYGTLKFKSRAGGYLWSDNIFPASTVVCDSTDTLFLRVKAIETVTGIPEKMVVRLFMKRPQDSYNYDDKRRINFSIDFAITADGNWHDVAIPLLDSNLTKQGDLGWMENPDDTIERLRLDWGVTHSGVVSTVGNNGKNNYEAWTGTSMACPHVSGIVALMLQKYRNTVLIPRNISSGTNLNIHDNPFWNSTARAIVVHTATDMVDTLGVSGQSYVNPDFYYKAGIALPSIYTEGPDWVSGFGLVNALKAVEYVDTTRIIEDTINQAITKLKKIHVSDSIANLRVTLCWDDPANVLTSEADAYRCKLVNNLDLYLRHVSTGQIVRPWVLDHNGMHADTIPADGLDSITPEMILNRRAFRGIDTVNNLEVVDINNPDTGIWEVYIVPQSITVDQSSAAGINQEYSLVSDIPFLPPPPPPDTVGAVMGFEVPSLWQFIAGTGTLSSHTSPKTQGNASMQIQGNGYQQIQSVPLNTTHLSEMNKIKVDLYVGNIQPNPYWIGEAQLFVHCPSAGLFNRYVGQVELTGLPRDVFNTLTFNLPSNILNALAGNYNDFSFSLSLNTNSGSGPYYFDNMRFSN